MQLTPFSPWTVFLNISLEGNLEIKILLSMGMLYDDAFSEIIRLVLLNCAFPV
jgi:hypothetical protein